MTNPPGAMPPLPEPVAHINLNGVIHEAGYGWLPVETLESLHTASQLQAYAAPLIARVAELERQNEAQKDEWLSWDAKRAALEKDAARWKAVRDHWKKANFTFRRDPANLLKSINLTVDFDHFTGGGASQIEREFDAAIAAKD